MPLKTQLDEMPQLNLTPLIDVVFLMIIFFMVATSFADLEKDIDLQLPEVAAATGLSSAPKQRIVSVHEDGRIQLDGQAVTLAELTSQLSLAQSEYPQLSVIIRGDAACPFQQVAATLAACKDAHISDLGITVKVAQAPGTATR
jgi:biopolymer transport protein ExbD